MLKQKGHKTALFDSTMMQGPDIAHAFAAKVDAFKPDAVGFSVLSNEWGLSRDLLQGPASNPRVYDDLVARSVEPSVESCRRNPPIRVVATQRCGGSSRGRRGGKQAETGGAAAAHARQ